MDTRGPQNKDDLGRHQRVLTAYLAHAGADPLPPPSVDASIMALAANAVRSPDSAPLREVNKFLATDASAADVGNSSLRTRRRKWPYALAASVATLGFAAILARTTFQDASVYDEPAHQGRSYETIPTAPSPAVIPSAQRQEQMADAGNTRAASAASTPLTEDKTKSDQQRSELPAVGGLAAAPQSVLPQAVDDYASPASDAFDAAASTGQYADDRPSTAAPRASVPLPEPARAAKKAEVPPNAIDLPISDARRMRSAEDAAPIARVPDEGTSVEFASKTLAKPISVEEAKAPSAAIPMQAAQAPLVQAAPTPVASDEPLPAEGAAPLEAEHATNEELARDSQAESTHAQAYAAIRALRDGGDILRAKTMLARFQKNHPKVQLPEDLAVLANLKQ